MASRYRLELDGKIYNVILDETDQGFSIVLDDINLGTYDVTIEGLPGLFSMLLDEEPTKAYVDRDGRNYNVTIGDRTFTIQETLGNQRSRSSVGSRQDPIGIISAPLAGVLVEIKFAEGDTFAEGQAILIIEAMKIFNHVEADQAGFVIKINKNSGDPVEYGEVIFVIDASDISSETNN